MMNKLNPVTAKGRKSTTQVLARLKKSLIEIILIAASLILLTQASIIKSTHADPVDKRSHHALARS